MRRRKELLAQQAAQNEFERAQHQVQLFENYLELLVSVHKDCSDPWRWDRIVVQPRPSEPQRSRAHEEAAQAAMLAYEPGFFARLFGGEKKRRLELESALHHARAHDAQLHEQQLAQYRSACESWEWFHLVAQGILARDPKAYRVALEHLVSLDEMEEQLGSSFTIRSIQREVAVLDCAVRGNELVPEEELSLGAKAKINHKKMAQGKYWALYQDHVCSCALRVGREVFALLPVERAFVNVGSTMVDSSTGHPTMTTFLAVHFLRTKLQSLNFERIDPSDAMKNFDHRMSFKKTSGFVGVEPMNGDEQFVSTG